MTTRNLNDRRVFPIAAAFVLIGFSVYSGVRHAPFVLDDLSALAQNPTIRSLWPLSGPLSPPDTGITVTGRPVANLTFALNYLLSGNNPVSYHWFNIGIHVAAALALFGLVRRSLQQPSLAAPFGPEALPLAAVAALLWMLHPLLTESISYTVQRTESLMGLFYLLTLYGFVRATEVRTARRPSLHWFVLSVTACALGMATKEVMATAPLVVLLYDRIFVSGSFADAWRRHRYIYAAYAATWVILAELAFHSGDRAGAFQLGRVSAWWGYWLTQFEAITHYLELTVWPHPLVFDYGTFWLSFGQAAPYAVFVGLLLVGSVWLVRRSPPLGFAAICFFLILGPSSLMPGRVQMIVEHRMYLSLAALIVPAVLLARMFLGRWSYAGFGALALAYAFITVARNADYSDEIRLWRGAVAARPENALAHEGFAQALMMRGQYELALASLQRAETLEPHRPRIHANLADAEMLLGRGDDATREINQAIDLLTPDNAFDYIPYRFTAAAIMMATEHPDDAVARYREILAREPRSTRALIGMGDAFTAARRYPDSLAAYAEAASLAPTDPVPQYRLGMAYYNLSQLPEAEKAVRESIQLGSKEPEGHLILGDILARHGDRASFTEAIDEFRAILGLTRDKEMIVQAHQALAGVYRALGDTANAAAETQAAARVGAGN